MNERTDMQLVEISVLMAWNRSRGPQNTKFNYQPVNHNDPRYITKISIFIIAQIVSFHNAFYFNPLNAELNPICNLLVLLGDLTFMSTCIVSIFQYISNKMQRYTVYLYLKTALHVSGSTSTHHQERIQLFPGINKLCNVASCWIYEYIGMTYTCCCVYSTRLPMMDRKPFRNM
jgi:hypothetical protein